MAHTMAGEHVYDGVTFMEFIPAQVLDKIKQMPLRQEDVILVTYPKAGTTWASEIISELLSEGKASAQLIRDKVPFVELTPPGKPANIDRLQAQPARRVFTTHLFPHFFEKEILANRPRVICLMRNPKDCLVSYYHYYRANGPLGKFQGSFEEFWDQLVITDRLCYGDVVKHQAAWWAFSNEQNCLFLKYEHMKRHPAENIATIARHLGVQPTSERIQELVEKTSFEKMSKDPNVNKEGLPSALMDSKISKYLRKGAVGDWRNTFSDEQSAYIDELAQKYLEPVGLTFEYEI